ncbi:hypothetical protein THAOC_25116, partial [Thalassiosira oceanica]
MEIEVPDRHGKWLYREPSARGSRNGPPSGPGRPIRRAFIENSALGSVRKCPFIGKTRPSALCGPLDRVVRQVFDCLRNRTKSSFLESSRRALQVALNRRIQIDGARAVQAREEMRMKPTQLPPGAVAEEERHAACCGGGRSARTTTWGDASSGRPSPSFHRPPRRAGQSRPSAVLSSSRLASGGRRRLPSGLAMLSFSSTSTDATPRDKRGASESPVSTASSGSSPLLPPADGAARPPGSLCLRSYERVP